MRTKRGISIVAMMTLWLTFHTQAQQSASQIKRPRYGVISESALPEDAMRKLAIRYRTLHRLPEHIARPVQSGEFQGPRSDSRTRASNKWPLCSGTIIPG